MLRDFQSNGEKRCYNSLKKILSDESNSYVFSIQKRFVATSYEEIKFIASIIKEFEPIEINQINGRIERIDAVFGKNYKIKFFPQYEVINSKENKYSVDLCAVLFADDEHQIACLGIEYDGHPGHFSMESVISSYRRDLDIFGKQFITILRFSQGDLKDKNVMAKLVRIIKGFFEHSINQMIKSYHFLNGKIKKLNKGSYIDCPICETLEYLGVSFCKVCSGVGRVPKKTSLLIDFNDHDIYECPECYNYTKIGQNKPCKECNSTRYIDRLKAIQLRKKQLEN
ncbi:hypothetical protein HP572_13010 [Pectobacterium sp. PL64]|uniref:hypothetical protein n=1 Tax=Pectobacterium sp. PL64 TaxID=2738983 RepID=UPI001F0BA094|nr:hypothetical protein [Pectobacterium sp. PL64]UMO86313.1 hypothetical protein HP572_13010 [Pectobacterium sp. PL64]